MSTATTKATTIWKYDLPVQDLVQLAMTEGAWVLDAQVQDGIIRLWVEIAPINRMQLRTFCLFGTGNPLPADFNSDNVSYIHINTVQLNGFVWHIYERVLDDDTIDILHE